MKHTFTPKKLLALFILISLVLLTIVVVVHRVRDNENGQQGADDHTTGTDEPAISFPVIPHDTDITTDSEIVSDVTDTTPSLPIPTDIRWEPNAIHNNYVVDGETLVFASINQPIFSGLDADVADKIHTVLEAYCREFVRITSDDRLMAEEAYDGSPFGFEPYERAGDFTVFIKDNVVSIRYQLFHDNGGADSGSEVTAFTFDLTTGDRLTFADYIEKDEAFGRDYLMTVFSQMVRSAPDKYYTDALDILDDVISLHDFYLTEEGLILFVNPDVLAPSAHGIITLTVPYTELGK
jgi:hypothetical protein